MKTLGEKLKSLRLSAKKTQIDVYKETGIHNKTLSGYENNVSTPDLDTIKILANYYKTSVDSILGNASPQVLNLETNPKGNTLSVMEKPLYSRRLKELRTNIGLTQQQVADKTDLTRAQYNNYEQGTREPDFDVITRLADFFGVTVDVILGKDNHANPVTGEALTVREITDLKKFIEQPNLSYDGAPVTEEEKEQLKKAMEFVFFQANEIAKKRKEATKKKKKLSN